MKLPRTLTVELLSDTTFATGVRGSGAVDVEVDHDDLGLPRLGGKALRGLLRDAWMSMQPHFPDLRPAAHRVLGPTRSLDETGILRVGDATLDPEILPWVRWAVGRANAPLAPSEVLEALTDVRSQTAEDRATGAPAETTLRTVRVVLRGHPFAAPLSWVGVPTGDDLACLAMVVRGVRHLGLGRNRGRGHVRLSLDGDADWTCGLLPTGAR